MYFEGNAAAPQNNATAFKYFSMAASKVHPQPTAVIM
jgi:SEL1 protein